MRKLLIHTWDDEDVEMAEKILRKSRQLKLLVVMAVFTLAVFLINGICHADTLKASWYSMESLKKEGTYAKSNGFMANGRVFKDNSLTCAARLYPLGTKLMVTNLANGKSVIVVVTDRIGKRFAKSRIDLSRGAFQKIADLKKGILVVNVKMRG